MSSVHDSSPWISGSRLPKNDVISVIVCFRASLQRDDDGSILQRGQILFVREKYFFLVAWAISGFQPGIVGSIRFVLR